MIISISSTGALVVVGGEHEASIVGSKGGGEHTGAPRPPGDDGVLGGARDETEAA